MSESPLYMGMLLCRLLCRRAVRQITEAPASPRYHVMNVAQGNARDHASDVERGLPERGTRCAASRAFAKHADPRPLRSLRKRSSLFYRTFRAYRTDGLLWRRGLLNRYREIIPIEGSNPFLSATTKKPGKISVSRPVPHRHFSFSSPATHAEAVPARTLPSGWSPQKRP